MEDNITFLVDMGFSRNQSIQALTLCGGSVEGAVQLLFESPDLVETSTESTPTDEYRDGGEEQIPSLKLVLLVRQDLRMGTGKIAAQCCHATLAMYRSVLARQPELISQWEALMEPKIVLRVQDENEMMTLAETAESRGIHVHFICDAGRTQVAPGSRTVVAIGPALSDTIDSVTGHLKLL